MLSGVKRGSIVSRRLLVASLALGLFLLLDIALFGWMIFRSLSQREVEEVLLETRLEAETLAEQIAGSTEGRGDLFTALASETVVQRSMDALREREIVHSLEVRDREGRLVYAVNTEVLIPKEPDLALPLDSPELAPGSEVETEVLSQESFSYEVPDVQVPIGDIGTLQIGVDPEALRVRIEKLRRDLIREASVIGAVTVALLSSAYLIIWALYRRSRRFEVQAAEAERMAYIGTLASGLAHEIRNPLNSLSLNMQMLGEELPDAGAGGSGARLLEITRGEIGRLERLVTDFLSYARPRPPELEEVPAAELLERTRQVLCGAARNHGVKLEAIDSTGGARLLVDPAQVRQLLLNLAQNALAATEERGRAAVVRLRAERRGTSAVLAVEDNGAGIPAADRERVFDLFYSTKKGGTGLGLAIVDRIAKNHGGRVELESEPGKGTVFSVLLPGAVVGEVVEAAEAAHA